MHEIYAYGKMNFLSYYFVTLIYRKCLGFISYLIAKIRRNSRLVLSPSYHFVWWIKKDRKFEENYEQTLLLHCFKQIQFWTGWQCGNLARTAQTNSTGHRLDLHADSGYRLLIEHYLYEAYIFLNIRYHHAWIG